MTKPRIRLVPLALGFVLGLGCTAILAPNDDTEPCEKTEDCPASDDNRYEAVCEFAEGEEENGICVAAFRVIGCDPGNYETVGDQVHPLKECIDMNSPSSYTRCPDDKRGQQGCPGDCDAGLEKNRYEVCDEPGATNPAVPAAPDEYVHQDILDQFCRSYFCDDEFVCDRRGNTCKRCEAGADYGEGGCGNLYRGGELSPVYLSQSGLDDACGGKNSTTSEPAFGSCEPPEADMQ